MSRLRVPLVAGAGPGAGTTTVAAALHARDGGPCEGAADVLVCGSDAQSLRRVATFAVASPPPLLAIVLAPGTTVPPRGRLRALDMRFGATVLLPDVGRWRGRTDAAGEAAAVLGQPAEHLPRELRAYAAALRLLTSALLRAGQLERPSPPVAVRPHAVALWRGLGPVERVVPARPALVTRVAPVGPVAGLPVDPAPPRAPDRFDDADDEELEAARPVVVGAVAALSGRAG